MREHHDAAGIRIVGCLFQKQRMPAIKRRQRLPAFAWLDGESIAPSKESQVAAILAVEARERRMLAIPRSDAPLLHAAGEFHRRREKAGVRQSGGGLLGPAFVD